MLVENGEHLNASYLDGHFRKLTLSTEMKH